MALEALNIPNLATPKGTRKMQEWDLITSIDFHAYKRIRLNGNKGTLFTVHSDRGISNLRDAYSNVLILGGHSQYAPEQSRRYVFISDARFK